MGGGGTDLASFYETEGGFWTSAAINLFVRWTVTRRWSKHWVVKFSQTVQRLDHYRDIEHDITRECLKLLKVEKWLNGGLEMNIISDVSSHSGLGVSGAITVGLLEILHYMKGDGISRRDLAEEAYHVEHDLCGDEATGKQDQYIAALGGITSFEVTRRGTVDIYPLLPEIDRRTLMELNENLVIFGSGIFRLKSAHETLKEQGLASKTPPKKTSATKKLGKEKIEYLKKIREIGLLQREAMLEGKINRLGKLLDEHWEIKKGYSKHSSEPLIDDVYADAKKAGALGGKIVGAGTVGGFWLFYVEANKKVKLRDVMLKKHGLEEVPWRFVEHGSMISYCE